MIEVSSYLRPTWQSSMRVCCSWDPWRCIEEGGKHASWVADETISRVDSSASLRSPWWVSRSTESRTHVVSHPDPTPLRACEGQLPPDPHVWWPRPETSATRSHHLADCRRDVPAEPEASTMFLPSSFIKGCTACQGPSITHWHGSSEKNRCVSIHIPKYSMGSRNQTVMGPQSVVYVVYRMQMSRSTLIQLGWWS